MAPKFSIIIPAHNSGKYIHKALESIAIQTFKDYEVIVVCDSCTDNTPEVVYNYGAVPVFVEYGADGLTRNKGMELAHGDYILFMDDDDWWLHEYVLDQLSQKLNEHPDIDILCFSFIFKGVGYALPAGLLYQSDFSIRSDLPHWIAPWCKCYKRSSIGDSRFSDVTDGSADVEFYLSMFYRKQLNIYNWDMPMYYYNYMRKGSQTERRNNK